MFFDIAYIAFIAYVIIIKYKKLCIECNDTKFQDIVKVMSVGTFAFLLIGSKKIIITLLFALLVHILVKILSLIYDKVTKKEKNIKCTYCYNPWKE